MCREDIDGGPNDDEEDVGDSEHADDEPGDGDKEEVMDGEEDEENWEIVGTT